MKRFIFLLSIVFVSACSSNGLNKPITQELTPDELRVNLKDNPSFGYLYEDYSKLREWIIVDNLRMAKYGSYTYKQLLDYGSCGPSLSELEQEHLKMYPDRAELRHQADSLVEYYRSIQPDSLLTISFKRKAVRRTILGNMPEFYLTVTPLKGKIDQFDFEYYFSPKINGETKIEDVSYSFLRHGRQSAPIMKEQTILCLGELWTDTLENETDEELHRDYNFIYKINNIRYKGQNWNDLSYTIQQCVMGNNKLDERIEDQIIQQMIKPDYVTESDLLIQRYQEAAKEAYPDIFAMYEEYNPFDYK